MPLSGLQQRVAGRRGERTSWVASIVLVATIAVFAWSADRPAVAVYALSYWHYYLYWLAYVFGAVPLDVFKRDAITMKTVSLAALAAVYLAVPPDPLSLVVVTAGFLLNARAALALGSDRTYYGYEIAGLPARRINAFPYSVISHPMLAGNIVAFAGTLINTPFREFWWPLAAGHVVMNLGLLFMELAVTPRHRGRAVRSAPARTGTRERSFDCGPAAAWGVATVAVGAGLLSGSATDRLPAAVVLGAGPCAYAYLLYVRYSVPALPPRQLGAVRGGTLHE